MELSDKLVEECHYTILHDNMNISLLEVHAQQVKESRLRSKNIEAMMGYFLESSYLKGKLDIKKSLDLKRGFLIKFLLSSLSLLMI